MEKKQTIGAKKEINAKHLAVRMLKVFLFLAVISSFIRAEASVYHIRLATKYDAGSVWEKGIRKFMEAVEKGTNGAVDFEAFYSKRAGKKIDDLSIVKDVLSGNLEMGAIFSTSLTNLDPKLEVLEIPFLFRDKAQANKVLNGAMGKEFLNTLLPHNLRGLAFLGGEFRNIYSVNREIHNPQQLAGLVVRVAEGGVPLAMYRTYGAHPVPANLSKTGEMVQKGFVQAADLNYANFWDFKLYDVLKVVNETNHSLGTVILVISESYFQKLPSNVRNVIERAAENAAKSEEEILAERNQEIKTMCMNKGIKIISLNGEERQDFIKAARPLYLHYSQLYGKDLIQKLTEER